MRKFKFRYTLRSGQTGSGVILAPFIEAVDMLVRDRFKFSDDVRIYDVKEVLDEGKDTVGRTVEADCVC